MMFAIRIMPTLYDFPGSKGGAGIFPELDTGTHDPNS